MRTILEFRALRLGLPACFKSDITDSQILRLSTLYSSYNYLMILEKAKANHISASWVRALKWAYFYNKLRLNFIARLRPLRRSLQKTKRTGIGR